MKTSIKIIAAALALSLCAGSAVAGEFTLVPGEGKGASTLDIGFSGDASTSDAQADVTFDANTFDVKLQSFGGASCTLPKQGMIRVITPDKGVVLAKSITPLCRAKFSGKGKGGNRAVRISNMICGDTAGNAVGGCGATEETVSIR